jgi:mRNA interferase MazF
VSRAPHRDEVWLASLDPSLGVEINQDPAVSGVSADEMNRHLSTIIVVPMTTTIRRYPTRVAVRFQGESGQAALDELRAVDRQLLIRKLGTILPVAAQQTSDILVEMFTRS